ncbi:MAG: biopolymer transporter ExbD [Planctomycetes bacterium]|nr:biopolymer transporter ExbD [Planctomycetota bacterium]
MKTRKIDMSLSEADMTPMIDIVFQLLTFFMIAINFENTKADERVKLPRDMLAKPPEVKPEHELVLNFGFERNEDGSKKNAIPTIFYNDRYVEVGQLTADLEQEKRVMEALHGKEVIDKVTVLIRADSEVPTGLVQQLIKKCQDNGFSKFSLRATAEEK